MTRTPHDALARAALSRPENAIGALRAALPPDLLAQLDLSSLRLSQGTFVTENLAERISDLIYEVELAGHPGAVCFVLYEHRSTEDLLLPVRLLVYIGHALDLWVRAHPQARRIPPILPVVLYHGRAGWTGPTSLREIMELPADAPVALLEQLPELRFHLDDLSRYPDAELLARDMAAFGRLTLLLLKHARWLGIDPDGEGSLRAFLRGVAALLAEVTDRADRVRIFRYIIEVVPGADLATVDAALGEAASPALREDVMNAAEKLRQEGREEGLREGRREGRREGEQRALLELLRALFGVLTPADEARVLAADVQTIESWLRRAPRSGSLAELWGEP